MTKSSERYARPWGLLFAATLTRAVISVTARVPGTPNLLQLAGLGMIAAGIWLVSASLALIVVGIVLVLIGQGARDIEQDRSTR